MHSVGVVHRDLKPENILLKEEAKSKNLPLTVKIGDLGTSKKLDRSSRRMNTPYVVSRFYRSPDLILGSTHYDFSIDIWAAGCILFELLARTPLFPGDSEGMQLFEHALIIGSPTHKEVD
jgi:glycogen synthase kinase 3 beta